MIPKIIHHTWVGDDPIPKEYIDTWKAHHPDWQFMLWDNERVKAKKFKNQKLIDYYWNKKEYPAVADIIRYEVLYEYGGFNPGADSECIHPIDELLPLMEELEIDAFSVYQDTFRKYIAPLHACTKGNEFAKLLIDGLADVKNPEAAWKTTGNAYMSIAVRKSRYKKIRIFPHYAFIPKPFRDKDVEIYKKITKVYAIHHWYSTKKHYAKK